VNDSGLFLALTVALFAWGGASAWAQVELPSVIGDNMVLQRQTEAAVWGWDEPGTQVSVTFRGRTVGATAGEDGRWTARVPTGDAGESFELTVKGSSDVTLRNVAVGEVWVAGGQSNMWWAVSNCTDAQEEIASADFPGIRFYDANTGPREAGWPADEPQRTIQARWEAARPGGIGGWAGTAYFFARRLHRELGVPVGIVHVAVPGSAIEPWLSPDFVRTQTPDLAELAESRQTSRFYNGMVAPVAPFTTRGFIWWQGESNQGRAYQYRLLFPGLILDWRRAWGGADLPFLYVELANFWDEQRVPVEDSAWPALRDAQREALRLPNVYMACTIDIIPRAEARNIHPPHKQLAGQRLALAALANVYGRQAVEWSGPMARSFEFRNGAAVVRFDHVGDGLVAKGGGELKGFAVCGPDRRWHWATAQISGDTVIASSEGVPEPVAVRYDWAANPIGNLYNTAGLPAPPFRSDHWLLLMREGG